MPHTWTQALLNYSSSLSHQALFRSTPVQMLLSLFGMPSFHYASKNTTSKCSSEVTLLTSPLQPSLPSSPPAELCLLLAPRNCVRTSFKIYRTVLLVLLLLLLMLFICMSSSPVECDFLWSRSFFTIVILTSGVLNACHNCGCQEPKSCKCLVIPEK